MRSSGTLMCLGSGAAFGAMAIFGKLAYGEGATVGTLLAVRFTLAAVLFWTAGAAARAWRARRTRLAGPAAHRPPAHAETLQGPRDHAGAPRGAAAARDLAGAPH